MASIVGFFCAAGIAATAATTVFDFETAAEAAALPYRTHDNGKTRLDIVQAFATSGTNALRFSTAAWRKGMPEWPAFSLTPAVKDWRGYDRLVVELTSPTPEALTLSLFISDSKVPFRQGLSHTFNLPVAGYARFIVPLSKFPASVKRDDIHIVHFFTERPKADMAVHIDAITLLKKDEAPPAPPPAFVRQLAPLAHNALAAADRSLAALAGETAPFCDTTDIKANANRHLARLAEPFEPLRAELAVGGAPTLARLDALQADLAALPVRARRLVSLLRLQQACVRAGFPSAPMLVGAATSMEQIMPRDAPFDLRPARPLELRLARNEKESLQLGVTPAGDAVLKNVSVRATDLVADGGATLASAQIDCDVTGYVETLTKPPYRVDHVGWWPDPILDFLGSVDIAPGDLQSFWIRVRALRDQTPGVYRGKLIVSAENAPDIALDLAVRVYGFTLPDESPLPLAVTFAPHDSPVADTKVAQTEWRKSPDYPINAWKKHAARWGDFLADYYITYDSLYHNGMPDFDILGRLHKQGRLGRFNLGYWYYFNDNDEARAKWKDTTLTRLRAAYDKAKEHGLLDHAYIYGCDEVATNHFARVEEAAALIKAACPGVTVMTTTYDHSFGMTSGIRSVDAFCSLTPKFDAAKAARARADGRQVWWYICCGPHHPHANMFIEYPAIEGRLLMGAMTARERPDGFLYYQISIWNARMPIASGPFTDWSARSWTTYHGDGAWTCSGPDGTPLPTQRLENFRDGLEDFAYVRILEECVRQRASGPETAWLTEARDALVVPGTLVNNMKEYARDPGVLYAWRARLADLIERAPAPTK